jgi:hypothetical protein
MVDEHAGGTVISCRSHRFPNRTIAPIQDGIGQVEQNSFVIDFLHMSFLLFVKRTGSCGLPFRTTLSHDARRVGQCSDGEDVSESAVRKASSDEWTPPGIGCWWRCILHFVFFDKLPNENCDSETVAFVTG